jgi:hypothetical protein
MLRDFLDLSAWAQWLASLDREFYFLLALPFVVAVVGLWSWWAEKEEVDREYESRAAQAEELERAERERRSRGRSGGAHTPRQGLR